MSKERKKSNSKWSNDDSVKKFIEDSGYTFKSLKREGNKIYVTYSCPKGHYYTKTLSNLVKGRVTFCNICEGNQYDVEKAHKFFNEKGFTMITEHTKLDKYGNQIVSAGERQQVTCNKEGHEWVVSISELKKKSYCPTCKGTISNAGFSRSEEIIARILDYNNIDYERQFDVYVDDLHLPVDFFLPEFNLFVEYDGAHHLYGRSDFTEEQNEKVKEHDNLRDEYARRNNIKMERIHHDNGGKSLVHRLKEILSKYDITIDENDSMYDDIVREVFDYCADRFGWLSYETIKHNADTYLKHSIFEAVEILKVHATVIARHFTWVYGMGKREYKKRYPGK